MKHYETFEGEVIVKGDIKILGSDDSIMPRHYFTDMFTETDTYQHFYKPGGNGSFHSYANMRVWDKDSQNVRTLRFGGDGKLKWDGTIEATAVGIGVSPSTYGLHIHGNSTIQLSDNTLGITYGGYVEGGSVVGDGGFVKIGTIDDSTKYVGIHIGAQAQTVHISGDLGIKSGKSLRLYQPDNTAWASMYMDGNGIVNLNYPLRIYGGIYQERWLPYNQSLDVFQYIGSSNADSVDIGRVYGWREIVSGNSAGQLKKTQYITNGGTWADSIINYGTEVNIKSLLSADGGIRTGFSKISDTYNLYGLDAVDMTLRPDGSAIRKGYAFYTNKSYTAGDELLAMYIGFDGRIILPKLAGTGDRQLVADGNGTIKVASTNDKGEISTTNTTAYTLPVGINSACVHIFVYNAISGSQASYLCNISGYGGNSIGNDHTGCGIILDMPGSVINIRTTTGTIHVFTKVISEI